MVQDRRIVALFIGSISLLAFIIGGPLIYAVMLSFYSARSFMSEPEWVGLSNYIKVLQDPLFWNSLTNGLTIALSSIVLQVVLGVGIAMVLNKRFVGQTIARSIAILPYFLPTVVACLVAQWILEPNYGLVKTALASIGVGMLDWSSHAFTAKGTIILVSVWLWTPFVVTCVLAGLQTIPTQLYEAARVDGAGAWTQFWHITIPGLRSVLIVVILLRGIWMFNKFDLIWLLTKGGPLNQTETLPTLAYRKSFIEYNLGGGAAVATISFLLLSGVILIYLRLFPIDDAKQGR
ncbi:sugar ABC transporter permease (plasmid) [Aminobacter sp. NyZ550]|uniref:Carbohydrate ABC transporter membrane protein 1, CUT1 family n=2 Tax=Alphaproteobacteria TaxID=28211 RepID=A0A1H7SE13_9RHOB|nr:MULTISPECIES: sugar ABC transporter permease [Alphaproteobacteria]MRX35953.1 ABC transporter permease subunit [Aminobacter sp. MDW-2]QNH37987.1 sugar ABC transporter permease [Aminobacter sp. MDW-2]QOF74936.1 sugar ABC transporter permease [Aminobacter sp. SR38]QQP93899.1 sugar ABC transporter permease [Skermanella sp. TT6]WAX98654.1 sugar ABC transporter permease [Aminobacter sp. NyZ550]